MTRVILGVVLAACVLAFGGEVRAVAPPPSVPVEDTDLAAWVHDLARDAEARARESGESPTRLDPDLGPQAEVARMELLEGGVGLGFGGAVIGIALVARRRRATVIRHSRRRLEQAFTIDCRPSFHGG